MKKFIKISLILLLVFLLPKIYAYTRSVQDYDLAEQEIFSTMEKGSSVLDLSEFSYLRAIPEKAYQIENLHRLNISRTRIDNIDKISVFRHLEHLSIRQTRVGEISSLTENEALLSLDIGATRVFDLISLPSLVNLTRLQMDRTFIQSLCPINDIEKLAWLNLYRSYAADGSHDCFAYLERNIDEVAGGNAFRQNYVPGRPYRAWVALDRFFEIFEWKSVFNAIQSHRGDDG